MLYLGTYLGSNQIGDEGMEAFSTAISSGALASLEVLYFYDNQIGDEGMKAFSTAISSGALASLQELYLHKNLRSATRGCRSSPPPASSISIQSVGRWCLLRPRIV
jgi:hypothetical protein